MFVLLRFPDLLVVDGFVVPDGFLRWGCLSLFGGGFSGCHIMRLILLAPVLPVPEQ